MSVEIMSSTSEQLSLSLSTSETKRGEDGTGRDKKTDGRHYWRRNETNKLVGIGPASRPASRRPVV